MTYRVVVTPKARHELYQDALWWAEHRDTVQAASWLEGFEQAILSLAVNPERHSTCPEAEELSVDLRQMLYGLGKRPTHRAVFEIRGEEVFIHAIRHLARHDLSTDDLAN